MKRLPPQPGEWIDRTRALEFRFEGRVVRGFAGDTLTSALLASGETVLGRSFKYHRPRSVFSLANHDVNALMQVAHRGQSRPNVRADVTPLLARQIAGLRAACARCGCFAAAPTDRWRWNSRCCRFPSCR